jgi:hypothetical protein
MNERMAPVPRKRRDGDEKRNCEEDNCIIADLCKSTCRTSMQTKTLVCRVGFLWCRAGWDCHVGMRRLCIGCLSCWVVDRVVCG